MAGDQRGTVLDPAAPFDCAFGNVAKLRRKVEKDPANPQVIVTVRGAGYRLILQAQ